MCGVYSGGMTQCSLDGLTESLLEGYAQELRQGAGLASRVVDRKKVLLASGELASDVTVDLIPGGRSRRLFAIANNGSVLVADCETYAEKWQKYQGYFDHVLRSLRIEAWK